MVNLILMFLVNKGLSQDSFVPESELSTYGIFSVKSIKANNKFSLEKFSLGVSGGINSSLVIPLSRNSVFSSQTPDEFEKDYDSFYKNMGMQMGFVLMYDISKFIKISLQPLSADYVYKYSNIYQWTGNTILQYETQYSQKLRFFEIPLIGGFYLNYKKFQPYFQAGVYYGRLINGVTDMSVIETSTNLSGSSQSLNYSTSANSSSLYQKNHYGVLGGAGIAYLLGKTRIGIEANYRILLSNLNTVETSFANNQVVSGGYDVPDKFKFSNLGISLNIVVPLMCKNSGARGGFLFCE